jgi:hypothetical protein
MHEYCRSKQLAKLLQTSRDILEHAGNGDWKSVAQLQEQQNRIARDIFEVSVAASEACEIAAAIKEVLSTNARILELLACEREACLTEVRTCGNRRQALKAYNSNA